MENKELVFYFSFSFRAIGGELISVIREGVEKGKSGVLGIYLDS